LSVRLSVPWCLGYRHAGCLQLSHRRAPEMCGLQTRPRTDVDPPRFLPPSNCHRRGHIVSPPPGRYIVCYTTLCIMPTDSHRYSVVGMYFCVCRRVHCRQAWMKPQTRGASKWNESKCESPVQIFLSCKVRQQNAVHSSLTRDRKVS